MPVYNGAQYIGESIRECILQSYENFELLIIDNGSIDETAEICKTFAGDARIKYIYTKRRGRSVARNIGLDLAQGEFIQFLDYDDFPGNSKIAKQISFLDENKNISGVYGDTLYFRNSTASIIHTLMQKKIRYTTRDFILSNIPINAFVFRPSSVRFDENMEHCEDWDFWIQMSMNGSRFEYTPAAESYVRIHDSNTSKDKEMMLVKELYMFDKLRLKLQNNRPLLHVINYRSAKINIALKRYRNSFLSIRSIPLWRMDYYLKVLLFGVFLFINEKIFHFNSIYD